MEIVLLIPELLKKNPDNTLDIVFGSEILIGQKVKTGSTPDGRPIYREITRINEQRKAKGNFKNKPWQWANVSTMAV